MTLRTSIEKIVARKIAQLPTALAERFASKSQVDGQTLDPHLSILLRLNSGRRGFEARGSVEAARQEYRNIISVLERPEPGADMVLDRSVDAESGAIPIRLYQPEAKGLAPAVLFFHGGGYLLGDLETHDGFCHRLSRELSATVVAVDYRLAPEHPFPAGVDDCIRVTQWLLESAESLGIDGNRVAVAGDSAGGNFAAVVSQEVPGIAFQLLIYPGTDARSQTRSKELFGTGFGLDKSTTDWFFASYVEGVAASHPRVSPAASTTLHKSPPTHVATAGFDVLRDDGREYARLLQEAGVDCTLEDHSSLSHGFLHMTRIPGCNKGVDKLVEALRNGLAPA